MEADETKALSGALELTDLSSVIDSVAEQAYQGLRSATVDGSDKASDEERRKALLLHLHQTRQRLLRLLVLVQWSNKAKAVVEVSNVLEKAASHASTLRDAADQLYHQHNDPFLIRAPLHDAPTALDVMQTGGYNLLPKAIESLRAEPEPPPRKRAAAIQLMDQLLRTELLKRELPPGLKVVRIANGAAELRSGDEFNVKLILVPAPPAQTLQSEEAAAGKKQSRAAAERQSGKPSTSGRDGDAMEVDHQHQDAETPFAAEQWRWRIMSLTILPGPRRDAWMSAAQTAYLQQRTDEMMWRAADAFLLREQQATTAKQASEVGAEPVTVAEPVGNRAGAPKETASEGSLKLSIPAASSDHGTSITGSDRDSRKGSEAQGALAGADKELVAPLDLMQRVLRAAAHKLVILEAMSWAQKQVEQGEQTWHGLMRRDKGRLLTGGRVTYWPEVKAILPQELKQIGAPSNGSSKRFVSAPPALELGMDAESQLKLLHEPELSNVDNEGWLQGPMDLRIDLHHADLEGALLQAAAAYANIQLAGLSKLLRSRGDIPGNSGEVVLLCQASSTADAGSILYPGNVRGYSSGLLELRFMGSLLLCICIQLTTGQILLRAGTVLQDSTDIVMHIKGEERRIFQLQKQTPPTEARVSAGQFALLQVARSLEKLFIQLCMRQRFLSHTSTISRFGLSQAPMPARSLKEYMKVNPLAPRFSSKHILVSSFPPAPPILSMLPQHRLRSSDSLQGDSRHSTPGLHLSPIIDLNPGTGPKATPTVQDAAQPTGGWAVQDPSRVTAILGEEGCCLQFYLASELKAGMRWEYALLVMSCDIRGQPVKVLKLVKVPERMPGNSLQRQQSGKRKRKEDAQLQVEEAETEETHQASATTGLVAGSQHELADVVEWCRERIVWEQLSLHLQIMGVSFKRAIVPASASKRLKTCSSAALGPSTPAEIAYQQRLVGRKQEAVHALKQAELPPPRQQSRAEGAEDMQLETRLWVDGLATLENLDYLTSPKPAGRSRPQLDFYGAAADSSSGTDGSWKLDVASSYLTTLQLLNERASVETLPSGGICNRTSEGLVFSYHSVSDATAHSAVQDLACITRLHTFVGRMHQLCQARQATEVLAPQLAALPPVTSQQAETPAQVSEWSVPGSGDVRITTRGLQAAEIAVYAATNWDVHKPKSEMQHAAAPTSAALPSVEVQNPATPPSTVFDGDFVPQNEHSFEDSSPQQEKQAVGDANRRLSDIFGDNGCNDGFSLDSMDLQTFRVHTSEIPTGLQPHRSSLMPTQEQLTSLHNDGPQASFADIKQESKAAEPSSQALRLPAVADLPAVRMTARWQPHEAAASPAAGSEWRIQCKLKAEPGLPQEVLSIFEDMADAGEEEVLLDALCICAAPLAALSAVLQPAALAENGLQPSAVMLQWPRPPYRSQLLLHTCQGSLLLVTLRFAASSLVWLSASVHTDLPDISEPTQAPTALSLPPLFAKLQQIPGVSAPEQEASNIPSGGVSTVDGVWCRCWALEQALQVVLRFAAGGTPEK